MGGLVYTGRFQDATAIQLDWDLLTDLSATIFVVPSVRSSVSGLTTGVQDFEMMLELTYQYELTPHLILQPDMQYIIQPGGTGRFLTPLFWGSTNRD
jgi:carbohydrate-selective porin OprB